jgi:hypothetical protein
MRTSEHHRLNRGWTSNGADPAGCSRVRVPSSTAPLSPPCEDWSRPVHRSLPLCSIRTQPSNPESSPMTALLLTECGDRSYFTSRRIRPHDRLAARLRARTLDTLLAQGVSPDSSTALSLRARKLISQATRRQLARALHTTVREAARPARPLCSAVPISRCRVIDAHPILEELAGHLMNPGPVDARGVAQVQLLLSDGSSPLYPGPGAYDLEHALQAAIDALMPRL